MKQLETMGKKKRRAQRIINKLHQTYPDAGCALTHENPLELLIATILSAQCTDKRVNQVTPILFKKYKKTSDYAKAPLIDLEQIIHSTGFYKNKSKNIKLCCEKLESYYKGEVPQSMEELIKLPGVGRKTANVILGTAFSKSQGVVVDTHVFRLAYRLGLTDGKSAEVVEKKLMKILPQSNWILFSHLLILHGRAICKARNPQCEVCVLKTDCPREGVSSES